MMNIILDVTRVLRRLVKGHTLTGIDRVTMAYMQHYSSKSCALVRWGGRHRLLTHKHSQGLFQWLLAPSSLYALRKILLKAMFKQNRYPQGGNTFLINTGYISLKHLDVYQKMHFYGIKIIYFVHDLIPINYPEYSNSGEDLRHKQKLDHILTYGAGVITNSHATCDEWQHYAEKTHLPIVKTSVALLASGISQPPVIGERPIDKPYFVMLSTIEPRKNHLLLLHVWRSLFKQLGQDTPHLFIIGYRGWECENVIDILDRNQQLKSVVSEISHCSDRELACYIKHSQALLFPSFAEGYGMPLIEALTLGVPVIASDIPISREIAADVPQYIDPIDGKRWREAILAYARPNSQERAMQLQRIRNFQAPTWEQHFNKIDSFLTLLAE